MTTTDDVSEVGSSVPAMTTITQATSPRPWRNEVQRRLSVNFRAMLSEHGLTVTGVARRACMPRTTLNYRIEHGTIGLAELIAAADLALVGWGDAVDVVAGRTQR